MRRPCESDRSSMAHCLKDWNLPMLYFRLGNMLHMLLVWWRCCCHGHVRSRGSIERSHCPLTQPIFSLLETRADREKMWHVQSCCVSPCLPVFAQYENWDLRKSSCYHGLKSWELVTMSSDTCGSFCNLTVDWARYSVIQPYHASNKVVSYERVVF